MDFAGIFKLSKLHMYWDDRFRAVSDGYFRAAVTVIFELLRRLFAAVETTVVEPFGTVVFELLGRLFGAAVTVLFFSYW